MFMTCEAAYRFSSPAAVNGRSQVASFRKNPKPPKAKRGRRLLYSELDPMCPPQIIQAAHAVASAL
jgi:hypothetical protein